MSDFVNRTVEVDRLRELAAQAPRLVVLRGRRRVGKSRLVREALGQARVLSYQADEQPEAEHLAALGREAAEVAGGVPGLRFVSWDEALSFLATLARDSSLVVVLDEFQYLCAAQPALPSIVQRHWDRWVAEQTRILLVIVGSAISFMEGLLDSGSPLYGRADHRPLLEPFDYRDAGAFATTGTSADELVRRYAVLGGTPQYHVWARARATTDVVRELMLDPSGPLHDEPLQLLRAERDIRDRGRYFGALAAIARGQNRTGAIASTIGIDASNTSKALASLAALAYVELLEPVGPGRHGARAIWRIRDPFVRFWFRRVLPNRSRLASGRVDGVWREVAADLDGHAALVFEDCCRDWFARYAQMPEARASARVGRWWSRDGQVEIDVVATDRRERYTFLGSCKWHRGLVGRAALDDLMHARASLGGPAAQAKLGIFARHGFSAGLRNRASAEGVRLVTARDLFVIPGSSGRGSSADE